MTRDEVFQAINLERTYQDKKWGTITEHPHSVGEWILILLQELKEAHEAWCEKPGDLDALLEILQVTAVGVACLEQHGVYYPARRKLIAETIP